VNEEISIATVEELFGMPVDEVRVAFRDQFARLRRAINGYEIVGVLGWLFEGFIGCDPWPEDPRGKRVCYWRGENGSGERWLDVWQRSIDSLLRMRLIESVTLPPKAAPVGTEFYALTPKGRIFLSGVPERYRVGAPSDWPRDDQEFWTVIVEERPKDPPLVFPHIAAEQPDALAVLTQFDVRLAKDSKPRLTGPHSLRWIPPSAFAFDEYPALEDKVGPRIIRSWFDTVINPLLESLKLERKMLEDRNWTWRVPPGRLESLRPVKESAWQVSTDNLAQLLSFYPDVEELIEQHDRDVFALEDACRILHRSVAKSSQIQEAYKKAKEDASPTDQGTAVSGVLQGPAEQHVDLLAQYVVNNAGELPNYYVHSPVWNKYRSDFLKSLEDAAISPLNDAAIQAGASLLNTVNDLIGVLMKARDRLSLWFDVPFYTSQPVLSE
jgi:hypothetical protein